MPTLIEDLTGSDLERRARAIEAAATTDDEAVVATLERLMLDPATGEQPRQAVAESLGRTQHPRAVAFLRESLTAADETQRGLGAIGLAFVSRPEIAKALTALLADKVNTVRNLAERSLLAMPEVVREHCVEDLLKLLEHPVPLTRSPAARLLGLTRDRRALLPLLHMLTGDRQWLARMWGAKGLGDLGAVEAFEPLARALREDEKNRVRAAAAEAIGKLPHPQVEAVLEAALSDEDGGVKKIAEEALAALRRSQRGETCDESSS